MSKSQPFIEGQVLIGSLFNEPMRIETVKQNRQSSWIAGLVGTQSEKFRKVTLTLKDIEGLTIIEPKFNFSGDGNLLRLGIQAYSLGITYESDPYFGLSISRVDPLPHQLEAIYYYLLNIACVRFLLADDAGARKTIMAGLLIREIKLRGLVERILIKEPIKDPVRFEWNEVTKVSHYYLSVNAMTQPMQVKEDISPYGERKIQ